MRNVAHTFDPLPTAPRGCRGRRGFTLVEAAIVTVVIGVGVVALLELLAAGTMGNGRAAQATTALGLVNNVHERALNVKYADLFATFNDMSYSPPVDASGAPIAGMAQWRQVVDVKYVDRNHVAKDVPDTQVEPVARVTVTILHDGTPIYNTSWLMAASRWP